MPTSHTETASRDESTHGSRSEVAFQMMEPAQEAKHIPAEWSWHYKKLLALRDSLLDDQADKIADVHEALETHSMDIADSATDEFDHNMALGILSHENDALLEVNAAIRRILDGTYGICEETGERIPEERLRAVPWARHTKKALERLEQQQSTEHVHLAPPVSLQGTGAGGLSQTPEPDEDLSTIAVTRRQQEEAVGKVEGDAGLRIKSKLV